MSFKLGGIILEDIILFAPELKRGWRKAGKLLPRAQRDISTHEKMVLVAMASFAHADGTSIHAAYSTYAGMVGCSVRSVELAVKKFLVDGVLVLDPWKDKKGREIRRKTVRLRMVAARAIELYCERFPVVPRDGGAPTSESHSEVTPEPDSGVATDSNDSDSTTSESHARDLRIPFGESKYTNPSMNPSAPSGAGEAQAPSPDGAGQRLHDVIARFKEALPAIREAVGDQAFNIWGATLYALHERGGVLTLSQPTRFLADATRAHADAIAGVVGKRVEVVVCNLRAAGGAAA